MEKLIVVVPNTKIIATGVLLGIGLFIGVNIGRALVRIAAPHISRLQTRNR